MDDGQVPPDSGDAKGTAARRARTRLGDVETVAATRLDMFGDNSLKEALSGRRPGPDEGEVPPVQALPADGDEPPTADADAGASLEPADAQHVDAAADAESEPVGGGQDNANADAAASDAPFDAPDADRLFAQAPDATGTGSPMREVSSIFDALDAIEQQAAELLQDPPALEPDSQDTVRPWEAEPPADTRPIRMEVSSIFDALDEAERGGLDGEHAAEPDAPASGQVNGWRAAPEELIGTAESDAPAEDVPADAAAASDAETYEAETYEAGEALPPPVEEAAEEPALEEAAEAASDDADLLPPELSVGPPFPDPTGAAPASDLAHPPPFFRSELEPLEPPPPPDHHTARLEAEANATAEALENLQRMLDGKLPDTTTYAPPPPPPARPEWPREQVVSSPPPLVGNLRADPRPAPPPHYVGGRTSAPLMPLPVPPQRRSRAGIYVLGFLAGLGLSLMAGLVLFFFIQLI